jgi:hypothetical protein
MVFIEELQLGGIQHRAAMCESIQLELQTRQLEPSFSKGENKQTLSIISERFMTVVLSGALTVLEG